MSGGGVNADGFVYGVTVEVLDALGERTETESVEMHSYQSELVYVERRLLIGDQSFTVRFKFNPPLLHPEAKSPASPESEEGGTPHG